MKGPRRPSSPSPGFGAPVVPRRTQQGASGQIRADNAEYGAGKKSGREQEILDRDQLGE